MKALAAVSSGAPSSSVAVDVSELDSSELDVELGSVVSSEEASVMVGSTTVVLSSIMLVGASRGVVSTTGSVGVGILSSVMLGGEIDSAGESITEVHVDPSWQASPSIIQDEPSRHS